MHASRDVQMLAAHDDGAFVVAAEKVISHTSFYPAPWIPTPTPVPQMADDEATDLEEDGVDVRDLTLEDAESLVGVSISLAATHLTSAKTPLAEKSMAMEELEGGGLFDSDEDATSVETPPGNDPVVAVETNPLKEGGEEAQPGGDMRQGFPEPWQAGPKKMAIQRPEETKAALRNATNPKRRSFSGSGEALRKLLPSMPKAGSFMQSLPSPMFFGNGQKSRGRSRASTTAMGSLLSGNRTPVPRAAMGQGMRQLTGKKATLVSASAFDLNHAAAPPPLLRRTTSDQSLLYTSLSRTSSLGDDSRFEHHHEMVNSRFKAIMDSLQDRSSFRLPAMPSISSMASMPSMPSMPNFDFSKTFSLYSGNDSATRLWNVSADMKKDILPGNSKKKSSFASASGTAMPVPAVEEQDREAAAADAAAALLDGNNPKVFDRAIANLTGDVVIMGGYRGSILRSAKPPHRQLWVPVKVGLNIRKVNMEVGLEDEDEERMEERIFASGMLQNIGPVDISRRLFKRLRETENARNGTLRVWDYGYDWRLSPHLLSRKLQIFLEGLPSNKPGHETGALVIAHSLGGLITRHVVNQRPELFSGVIYAGVPQSCINILGPLRNGDAVLLSSRVLTAQVNFSLRTSFLLLPLSGLGFIDKHTKEPYRVDFFDVNDWVKYRFSPCTDPPLPAKNPPPNSSLANLLSSSLPRPGRKAASSTASRSSARSALAAATGAAATTKAADPADAVVMDSTHAPHMDAAPAPAAPQSVSTTVTLPRPAALEYLARILPRIRAFKEALAHRPDVEAANAYPPLAVIYGKSVPTVHAAQVDGRDGIACADVYEALAFASGDGVCLAREAQLPGGYRCVRGGRVGSERGHLTLLGDLEAVGRAVEAVTRGRERGIGRGVGKGK